MKQKIMLIVLMVFGLMQSGYSQVLTACLTMEQSQAKYNQDKANAIVVRDTASQQLQCHHQQLATYWNQVHKDNQQKAKDAQQIAKDIQQFQKDEQQKASDKGLTLRLVELQNLSSPGYDEVKLFIEAVLPLLGSCDELLKLDLKRVHTNRSGGGDLTNPGGGGNLRGFDNPHMVR